MVKKALIAITFTALLISCGGSSHEQITESDLKVPDVTGATTPTATQPYLGGNVGNQRPTQQQKQVVGAVKEEPIKPIPEETISEGEPFIDRPAKEVPELREREMRQKQFSDVRKDDGKWYKQEAYLTFEGREKFILVKKVKNTSYKDELRVLPGSYREQTNSDGSNTATFDVEYNSNSAIPSLSDTKVFKCILWSSRNGIDHFLDIDNWTYASRSNLIDASKKNIRKKLGSSKPPVRTEPLKKFRKHDMSSRDLRFGKEYRVKKGDTIWRICQEVGITDKKLYSLNRNLREYPTLKVGEILRVAN